MEGILFNFLQSFFLFSKISSQKTDGLLRNINYKTTGLVLGTCSILTGLITIFLRISLTMSLQGLACFVTLSSPSSGCLPLLIHLLEMQRLNMSWKQSLRRLKGRMKERINSKMLILLAFWEEAENIFSCFTQYDIKKLHLSKIIL